MRHAPKVLSGLLEKLSRALGRAPRKAEPELERDVRESVERTATLIEAAVARGNSEFVPLLADVRALRSKAIDASFGEAVRQLHDVFPYVMDQYVSHTWSESHHPEFRARLLREGARFGAVTSTAASAIDRSLSEIRACTKRALFVPTKAMLAAAAAAEPTERTLDLGRHRLHFLKAAHGGGVVIDDGWYVPAGRALHAVLAPGQDYLVVKSEASERAPGGLYLVDARRHRWTRLALDDGRTPRLEQLELDDEGVWIPIVETSGKLGRMHRRYAAETFAPCTRR
jgi:hypothetical protein